MPSGPLEDPLAAHDPDDAGDETERHAEALQHGPLLDVELEKGRRERAGRGEGGTPDAAGLLAPERDDGASAHALDGLDRRHDAERAVEPAALGDRVEVRAEQDGRLARPPEEVAGFVDLDREAGLGHPGGGEVVRALFALGAADAVRPGTVADCEERVEPLLDAIDGQRS
jgi:hypothetical protein